MAGIGHSLPRIFQYQPVSLSFGQHRHLNLAIISRHYTDRPLALSTARQAEVVVKKNNLFEFYYRASADSIEATLESSRENANFITKLLGLETVYD